MFPCPKFAGTKPSCRPRPRLLVGSRPTPQTPPFSMPEACTKRRSTSRSASPGNGWPASPHTVRASRRPAPSDSPEVCANWHARLRLFEKVGGRCIAGASFAAQNYADEDGPPVPLELCLIPVDEPESAFDDQRLRDVAEGLLRR